MGEEHSIKNLVSRTETDPWNALLGRRPQSYRIPEVGNALINTIDFAVFERRTEDANVTGVIFEKWAETQRHFVCKAAAVMSTVYCIMGAMTLAEKKVIQAKKNVRKCKDCKGHYFKRTGTFLIYEKKLEKSLRSYTKALTIFGEMGNDLEKAKCLMSRGVVKSLMNDLEGGLRDQEDAAEILDPGAGHYVVIAAINTAWILTKMGRRDDALEKIDEAQSFFTGIKNVERPRLILRWINALLLEGSGKADDRKSASQILARVDARMHTLDMHHEIRVLLADRARIAKSPHAIRRLAYMALEIEETRQIRRLIETVIDHTTHENILKWRSALDSYVPPFYGTA